MAANWDRNMVFIVVLEPAYNDFNVLLEEKNCKIVAGITRGRFYCRGYLIILIWVKDGSKLFMIVCHFSVDERYYFPFVEIPKNV